MNPQEVAALSLIASLVVYTAVAFLSADSARSAQQFYNNAGNVFRAIISLTCFNITLGTGVAYVISQTIATGYFSLLTPFSLMFGYVILGQYMKRLGYMASEPNPNIYRLLESPTKTGFARSWLRTCYSFVLAVTFVLIVAYELWIGSGLIASLIFSHPSIALKISMAVGIYLIVAIYTSIGGLRAAVDTDLVQGGAIIGFILAFGHILLLSPEHTSAVVANAPRGTLLEVLLATILAAITAVTTQFYSIVNGTFGPHFTPPQQRWIFTATGIVSGFFYAVLVVLFLMSGRHIEFQTIVQQIVDGSIKVGWGWVLLLSLGMIAIILSTLDNASVSISQVVYENVLGKNSFDEQTVKSTRGVREAHFLASLAVVCITIEFVVLNLNAFYTLLTVLFALSVASPLIAAAIYLHGRGRSSVIDNPFVACFVFIAISVGWYFYAEATLAADRTTGPLLHIAFFLVSLVIAIVDANRGRARVVTGIPT